MRPKSMATVVLVFVVATGPASSTPMLTAVIAASVVNGSISETAPTNVVLPTAQPPATSSFTDRGARAACTRTGPLSECPNAIKHPLQQRDVLIVVRDPPQGHDT